MKRQRRAKYRRIPDHEYHRWAYVRDHGMHMAMTWLVRMFGGYHPDVCGSSRRRDVQRAMRQRTEFAVNRLGPTACTVVRL